MTTMTMNMEKYWNHNTAFHDEMVADVKKRGGRLLDIGCGDGLLLQRMAPYTELVVGIDPDAQAIERARVRLAATKHALLLNEDFLSLPSRASDYEEQAPIAEAGIGLPAELFDTITCVATLHHMDLRSALSKMSEYLAPGGRLLIVGLAANKSFVDYLISGLSVIPIRIMDRVHGGVQEINVRIAEPRESISDIRDVAREVLPGAIVRRRFYYRYMLIWDKAYD